MIFSLSKMIGMSKKNGARKKNSEGQESAGRNCVTPDEHRLVPCCIVVSMIFCTPHVTHTYVLACVAHLTTRHSLKTLSDSRKRDALQEMNNFDNMFCICPRGFWNITMMDALHRSRKKLMFGALSLTTKSPCAPHLKNRKTWSF